MTSGQRDDRRGAGLTIANAVNRAAPPQNMVNELGAFTIETAAVEFNMLGVLVMILGERDVDAALRQHWGKVTPVLVGGLAQATATEPRVEPLLIRFRDALPLRNGLIHGVWLVYGEDDVDVIKPKKVESDSELALDGLRLTLDGLRDATKAARELRFEVYELWRALWAEAYGSMPNFPDPGVGDYLRNT